MTIAERNLRTVKSKEKWHDKDSCKLKELFKERDELLFKLEKNTVRIRLLKGTYK
jgi:hypothetical protein